MLNPRAKPFELHKKQIPSPFYMNSPNRSFHHPPPPFSCYHSFPRFHRVYPLFPPPPPPPPFPSFPSPPLEAKPSYPTTITNNGKARNVFQFVRKDSTRNHVFITPRAYRREDPSHGRRYKHCSNNTTWKWKPKASGNDHSEAAAVQPYDFNEAQAKTTLMIKNIPNKLSKETLLEYLDKHCVEENEKLKSQPYSSDDSPLPNSEYDFVYLPMDFRSGYNLGYAFVNFTTSAGAVRFYSSYHNLSWGSVSRCFSNCGKTCMIKNARIQGKEKLKNHFQRSYFRCHTDDYLPTVFTPPRDGEAASTPSVVGRRPRVSCSG